MNKEIRLMIAGDFCPYGRVEQLVEERRYDVIFGDIKKYTEDSDFSIVNFETTVVDDNCNPIDKRGPNLSCSIKAIDALKYAGFDCVTLANNHFRDFGNRGCELSFDALKSQGLYYVGAGMNASEAKKVLYKEIKGKTIAICNFCEHEFSIAGDSSAGCNPIDPISNYYQIVEARSKANFVIVITHGGHEHFQYPSPRMKKLYRFYVDCGADAVINHHQHCFSGYEVYNGKPIYYGLGNFSFDWFDNDLWHTGFFVVLSFKNDNLSSQFIPYKQGGGKIGVSILKGEEKDNVIKKIEEISAIIQDDKLLEEKCSVFFDNSQYPYLFALEPIYSRIKKSLYIRRLYPSKLTRKRVIDLFLFLKCESHFERIERILEKIFK